MIGTWLPWREEDSQAQVRGRRGEVTFSDHRHHSSYPIWCGQIDIICSVTSQCGHPWKRRKCPYYSDVWVGYTCTYEV